MFDQFVTDYYSGYLRCHSLCVITEKSFSGGVWAETRGCHREKKDLFFFSLFFFCCKFCAQKKIALASFYQHFCLLRMCQMQDLVSHLSECLALSLSSYFSSSYYQPFWSCYSFCQSFSYFFFCLRRCHFGVEVHSLPAWSFDHVFFVQTDLGNKRKGALKVFLQKRAVCTY